MGQYALLVGINKFRQGDIQNQDLRGCVEDVAGKGQTRDHLVHRFGFKDSDIQMLLDERAKKKEIWSRLEQYMAELKSGDTLVWWQSCHGTRYPMKDKKTGRLTVVDALCATDFTWNEPGLDGPSLKKLFSRARPGVKILCAFDACHTGDTFRDLRPPGETTENSENYRKPRYVRPPADILHRFRKLDRGLGQNPEKGETPSGLLFYSGCDSDQTSDDAYIEGTFHGAFTYTFWKTVNSSPATASYLDLMLGTRAALKATKHVQNCGLEGDPEEAKQPFLGGAKNTEPHPEEASLSHQGSFWGGYSVNDIPPEAGV